VKETIDHRAGSGSPTAETFRIAVEPRGAQTVLVLEGQIGLDAGAHLRAEAEGLLGGSGGVAIDWRSAAHVGAGAVQILLALQTALAGRGRALRVAGENPEVRRFLEFAGLSGHFPILERTA